MISGMHDATQEALDEAIHNGLKSFARQKVQTMDEWAAENFYLSAEGSYVEGKWESLPFQKGILNVYSNDDVRLTTFIKSARVGASKMMLISIAYHATHKRRSQGLWQPTDDDADEFVRSEIDPMIRDVASLRDVAPWAGKKSPQNTLRQKMFVGSTLYIKGAKAAKNFRRVSLDVGYEDELDGMDTDVEKEGSPVLLGLKRVEGAVYPKFILSSTPKLASNSMIQTHADQSDVFLRFHTPCPKCGEEHVLIFGDKTTKDGMKWENNDPKTVKYQCPHCAERYTQAEFLDHYHKGVWRDKEKGIWLDADEGLFYYDEDKIASDDSITALPSGRARAETPETVAFHIWTAYSPFASWRQGVREFLDARRDPSRLKTWTNTYLGEVWDDDPGTKLDADTLYMRREHYKAQVPDEALLVTSFTDTQDDRLETTIVAWGAGEEAWVLGHHVLYGDPSKPVLWDKQAELLRKPLYKADGTAVQVHLAGQDHGGHYSDEVNAFSKRMGVHFLIPTKGHWQYDKPIIDFPRTPNKKGVYLSMVGTDVGKSAIAHRLMIFEPGPSYIHFSVDKAAGLDHKWFEQVTAEKRTMKYIKGKRQVVWDSGGRRNEAFDCLVGNLAMAKLAQQHFGVDLNMGVPVTQRTQPAAGRRGVRKVVGGIG